MEAQQAQSIAASVLVVAANEQKRLWIGTVVFRATYPKLQAL